MVLGLRLGLLHDVVALGPLHACLHGGPCCRSLLHGGHGGLVVLAAASACNLEAEQRGLVEEYFRWQHDLRPVLFEEHVCQRASKKSPVQVKSLRRDVHLLTLGAEYLHAALS